MSINQSDCSMYLTWKYNEILYDVLKLHLWFFFSATAVFGISKDFYFCNIISWWQWEKWDTILRLNFLCLKWYCKISQKIRFCGKIKDIHVLRFKLYINSHGIFLVNIVTVKINEVLRMGWKMHLGVVILNLPFLKSSLHVYHTLLSSSNLKLCHLIKIRSFTHWLFSVMDFCIDWCFIVCSSGAPQSSLGLYGVLCPHQWTWQEQLGLSSPPC